MSEKEIISIEGEDFETGRTTLLKALEVEGVKNGKPSRAVKVTELVGRTLNTLGLFFKVDEERMVYQAEKKGEEEILIGKRSHSNGAYLVSGSIVLEGGKPSAVKLTMKLKSDDEPRTVAAPYPL